MNYLTLILFIMITNISAMAKEIKTAIVMNARPEQVWTVLTNFSNYATWNPFIKSVGGEVKVGNTIKVKIQPEGSKGMTFAPKVLIYERNNELRWRGKLFIKGLFDGEHLFKLVDNGNGTTTFIHSEKFSGILVGLFNLESTLKGFEAMNRKLKELAEN